MPNTELPNLSDIINQLPHRVLTVGDIVRHCNAACEAPSIPTKETAHCWSDILDELLAHGWKMDKGFWMPPMGES